MAVSGESASSCPLYMYSITLDSFGGGCSVDRGDRWPFFLRFRIKKNTSRARPITPTGMPTPNPIFSPKLLADDPSLEAKGDNVGALWGSKNCELMLVKPTPAELMTTDVMRMTLEIGAGVDVITSTFSFLDGPFVKDGAAVSDVAVAEGGEAGLATLADGRIRIRIFYTGCFHS